MQQIQVLNGSNSRDHLMKKVQDHAQRVCLKYQLENHYIRLDREEHDCPLKAVVVVEMVLQLEDEM